MNTTFGGIVRTTVIVAAALAYVLAVVACLYKLAISICTECYNIFGII